MAIDHVTTFPLPPTVPAATREPFAHWLAIVTAWVAPKLDSHGGFTEMWPFTGVDSLRDDLCAAGMPQDSAKAFPAMLWAVDKCNAARGIESEAAWVLYRILADQIEEAAAPTIEDLLARLDFLKHELDTGSIGECPERVSKIVGVVRRDLRKIAKAAQATRSLPEAKSELAIEPPVAVVQAHYNGIFKDAGGLNYADDFWDKTSDLTDLLIEAGFPTRAATAYDALQMLDNLRKAESGKRERCFEAAYVIGEYAMACAEVDDLSDARAMALFLAQKDVHDCPVQYSLGQEALIAWFNRTVPAQG